ncbi:hypothetical protein FrEUN1fDRAFT_4031 [Parafrankia sp. EUN1f]|nr:hypothetical protein FrEUN1fDRAFT_4031 [Parafrankia sp. EUN1f]
MCQRFRAEPGACLGQPSRGRFPALLEPARVRERSRETGRDLLVVLVPEQRQRHHEQHDHPGWDLPTHPPTHPPIHPSIHPPTRFAAFPVTSIASSISSRDTNAVSTPSEIQSVNRPSTTGRSSATGRDHAGNQDKHPAPTQRNPEDQLRLSGIRTKRLLSGDRLAIRRGSGDRHSCAQPGCSARPPEDRRLRSIEDLSTGAGGGRSAVASRACRVRCLGRDADTGSLRIVIRVGFAAAGPMARPRFSVESPGSRRRAVGRTVVQRCTLRA